MPSSTKLLEDQNAMESNKFQNLRKSLDEMGYYQQLVPDAVDLVETILSDLLVASRKVKEFRTEKNEDRGKANYTCSNCAKSRIRSNDTSSSSSPYDKQVHYLEKRVFDLQLINEHSVNLIKKLQEESLEKSRKILNFESSNKARIIVQESSSNSSSSSALKRPKLELTKFAKKRISNFTEKFCNEAPINVTSAYEKKNSQLRRKIESLEEKIRILSKSGGVHFEDSLTSTTNSTPRPESAYILNLIRENLKLKESLEKRETQVPDSSISHKKVIPSRPRSHSQYVHRRGDSGNMNLTSCSYDDLTLSCNPEPFAQNFAHANSSFQAYKSHGETGKVKVTLRSKSVNDLSTAGLSLSDQHNCKSNEVVRDLKEREDSLMKENHELRQRIAELNLIRENQRQKLDELKRERDLFFGRSGNNDSNRKKVHELIGHIERQRDLYKSNMEKLIQRLDLSQVSSRETSSSASDSKIKTSEDDGSISFERIKKINDGSKRILGGDKESSYRASQYLSKSSSIINQEQSLHEKAGDNVDGSKLQDQMKLLSDIEDIKFQKTQTEQKLNATIRNLQLENQRLLKKLDAAAKESSHENNDDASTSSSGNLRMKITENEVMIADLETQLNAKQSHLNLLLKEQENLKTKMHEMTKNAMEMKRIHDGMETKLSEAEANRSTAEERLRLNSKLLEEAQNLLKHQEDDAERSIARKEADKLVSMDLRKENSSLKLQVHENEEKIGELRNHVQRYLNEIKRAEELIELRERERKELLEQYKALSEEMSSAEVYNRKIVSQAESLRVQLETKDAELRASEKRLSDIENDLMETTLANENYRAEIAMLHTKMDLAETQLKEAQSQSTWANVDISNVNQLAAQLNTQKVELQNQIARQNSEIETLNEDIRKLRDEVENLSVQVKEERNHSQVLETRLNERSRLR